MVSIFDFNDNMLNEIFRETQRTVFVCAIHVMYLLCLYPESPCDVNKNAYSKLTGFTRLLVSFFDQATFFMCRYFIPYVGYLVIALQYWFLVNVIYNWFFPSLARGLRNGTFGDFESDYSVQNDKELMRELRKMIALILKGISGTVDTSLTPLEIHCLRTWELYTVRKKEHDRKACFINPIVSLYYNSHDPRSEFLKFGTSCDGSILSLVISDKKFASEKDFMFFAMKWTMDLMQGVRYLHERDLYHLNLRTENIMVNFGPEFLPISSKAVIGNFKDKKNTLGNYLPQAVIGLSSSYIPPEAYISRPDIVKKADIGQRDFWDIGIIILELLTGGILTIHNKHHFTFNRMNVLAYLLQRSNFFFAVESVHGYERSNDFLLSMELGQNWNLDELETGAVIDEDIILNLWVLISDLLRFDPSSGLEYVRLAGILL